MKSKYIALVIPVLMALLLPVSAQSETNPQDTASGNDRANGKRFWEANLSGGNYMVALGSIVSVSKHRYVLDGSVVVDEVVIDTTGHSLARFYYIAPLSDDAQGTAIGESVSRITERGKEVLEQASDRAGTELHNMVVKTYPQTTHANQVEYRVLSAEALNALYGSVKGAWESGRGRVCNVR